VIESVDDLPPEGLLEQGLEPFFGPIGRRRVVVRCDYLIGSQLHVGGDPDPCPCILIHDPEGTLVPLVQTSIGSGHPDRPEKQCPLFGLAREEVLADKFVRECMGKVRKDQVVIPVFL